MAFWTNSKRGHVAVLAYPFTSHPFVMFNLLNSLAISAPSIQFSFFNTPKSNKILLSSKDPEALPHNVRIYDLDDGCVPEGSGLLQEINCFLRVFPANFKPAISLAETMSNQRITYFLTDALFSSAVADMAEARNVCWIGLWVPAPYALPGFLQMEYIQQVFDNSEKPEDLILDIVPGMSPISFLDLPCREVIEPIPNFSNSAEPSKLLFLSMAQNLHRASAVISNSFQELNPEGLVNHLKSKFQNFLFLGALTLSEPSLSSTQDKAGCLSWLDRQKPETVTFISFGTGIGCSPKEYYALAEALDSCNIPFLWVLNDKSKGRLPSGFIDRTSEKGKIVSWGPQSQILRHPSIGVYVTHCGYNSVLESVIGSVPMICRSIWTDNHMNAKMIEEVWEIGVRIEGRKITKQAMVKSFETIFLYEKRKKYKENINNLKQVLLKAAGPDGVARCDFKSLVEIISKCRLFPKGSSSL